MLSFRGEVNDNTSVEGVAVAEELQRIRDDPSIRPVVTWDQYYKTFLLFCTGSSTKAYKFAPFVQVSLG